jgi:CRISPR type I-E-associated protein CasB/Cse2
MNGNDFFWQNLQKLRSGELAILRRAGDNPLKDERCFPVLAKLGCLDDRVKALVAGLYAVVYREGMPMETTQANIGFSLRHALEKGRGQIKPEENDGRLRALISSHRDQLDFRLRQTVRLIDSRNVPIDFKTLLRDLYSWDHEERWVQRSWTRGFYFTDRFEISEKNEEGN